MLQYDKDKSGVSKDHDDGDPTVGFVTVLSVFHFINILIGLV